MFSAGAVVAPAEAALDVSWPAQVRINPDTTTYTVTTTGTNPDTDRFVVGPGIATPTYTRVDADRSTRVTMPDYEGSLRIDLVRCTTSGCRTLEYGPTLELRTQLTIADDGRSATGPASAPWRFDVLPTAVTAADVDWWVYRAPYAAGDAAVASGTATGAAEPFTLPSLEGRGLVHGTRYLLRMEMAATGTAWGNLRGVLWKNFDWDAATAVAWRRSVRPVDVMTGKTVGRCAALKRPARVGWPGSLGYRSERCAPRRQTRITTTHRIAIPASSSDRYDVRVSVFGGKALGVRRSQVRLSYRRPDGTWVDAGVCDGRLRLHPGARADAAVVHGLAGDTPALVWRITATNGARYDVKRFVVDVTYRAAAG